MEWRKKSDTDWWLMFSDAPEDLGVPSSDGTMWPPSMTVSHVAGSCWHLYSYYNGAMPDDDSDDDVDYVHICDLDEFIGHMQALRATVPNEEEVTA